MATEEPVEDRTTLLWRFHCERVNIAQNDGASQSGRELIDRCVAQLVEKQLVSVSDADELCVTKLGRAALKAIRWS